MAWIKATLVVLSTLFMAAVLPAQSDEAYDIVKLKNGQELVGRITAETDRDVTVLFRGGEIVLPKRRVKEIVRAERQQVEAAAAKHAVALGRYDPREEFFLVYYRGKCVGWRRVALAISKRGEEAGYLFEGRTVFVKSDGAKDMDLSVSEFVDHDLNPRAMSISEISGEYSTLMDGRVDKGHLDLRCTGTGPSHKREILFADETELYLPLVRQLADMTHFPAKGQEFKVFDSVASEFRRVKAKRGLRKEIVGGKHQFVTVWTFESGRRSWEVWVDGYGGIVREELGGPHMVALRADREKVVAFSEGKDVDVDLDLSLEYANIPAGFKLARPNLTWSFEFPEFDSPVAVTLVNPTLQASVDVVALSRTDAGTEAETVVMDLIDRMERKSDSFEVLYQEPTTIGGAPGVLFEATSERRGTDLRTMVAVTISKDRGYAMLLAAPAFRFHEARPALERILESFEPLEPEQKAAAVN